MSQNKLKSGMAIQPLSTNLNSKSGSKQEYSVYELRDENTNSKDFSVDQIKSGFVGIHCQSHPTDSFTVNTE